MLIGALEWGYAFSKLSFGKLHLGDNRIQNVHLGRYIVSYMVGSFVLRQRVNGAIKHNFQPYN